MIADHLKPRRTFRPYPDATEGPVDTHSRRHAQGMALADQRNIARDVVVSLTIAASTPETPYHRSQDVKREFRGGEICTTR